MIYVIGSGPAGVAAAYPLVEAGLSVTLLDAGRELEPEIDLKRQRLASLPFEKWPAEIVATLKQPLQVSASGLQRKLAYGSGYSYEDAGPYLRIRGDDVGSLLPSFARGGFSTVWGAAVLPFSPQDIAAWPFPLSDLEPHYRAVLSVLPLAADRDGLSDLFPLYCERPEELRPSAQAAELLSTMRANEDALHRDGLHFGRSRLAVRGEPKCIRCGMCLHGCPHELIYSTAQLLDSLSRRENFRYEPGVVVRQLRESGSEVIIDAIGLQDGLPKQFTGGAVFLAAGVLPTAKILLDSFPDLFSSASLSVSEYFLVPGLLRRSGGRPEQERLHTLSQIFLEYFGGRMPHSTHIQLYTYSDLYRTAVEQKFRLLGPLRRTAARLASSRLVALQGYLHSDISSRIDLRSEGNELHLNGKRSAEARDEIRATIKQLYRSRRALGFTVIPPLLSIGLPGEGRHVGGSFPMSREPRLGETDICGKLNPFERIYVADSSVFPTVPASTITLTVMANARRIAASYIRNATHAETDLRHHRR